MPTRTASRLRVQSTDKSTEGSEGDGTKAQRLPRGASCRWGGSELGLVYDNDRHDNPAAEIS